METARYCEIYRIDKALIPVLNKLPKQWWRQFNRHPIMNARSLDGVRHTIIYTGWYSRVKTEYGATVPKRMSCKKQIIAACDKAGFIYEEENLLPKKGALGETVKIYY